MARENSRFALERPFQGDLTTGDSWDLPAETFPKSPFTYTKENYGGDDRTYVRAFWSYAIRNGSGDVLASRTLPGSVTEANDSFSASPQEWTETVISFWVWDFGTGGGDNAVLIDAFDPHAQAFLPDDFVTVKPDPEKTLTPAANDGFIDTDTQIAKGVAETIEATDIGTPKGPDLGFGEPSSGPRFAFAYWRAADAVTFAGDDDAPPTVGAPEKRDIVVHHHDVVNAVAMYTPVDPTESDSNMPGWATWDPLWWWKTGWGRIPPYPPFRLRDRAEIEIESSQLLLDAVRALDGDLRTRGLDLVADALEHKARGLREEVDGRRRGPEAS